MIKPLAALPVLLLIAASPTYQPWELDADEDGAISEEEYQRIAAKVFIRADEDNDGYLGRGDIHALIDGAKKVDMVYRMKRADADQDGLLSESELVLHQRRQNKARRAAIKAATDSSSANESQTGVEADHIVFMNGHRNDIDHYLSDEKLRELRVKAYGYMRKLGSAPFGLSDYQSAKLAQFKINDANGDGYLTSDELPSDQLFRR